MSAILSAREEVGGGLFLVTLDVDDARARAYVAPGQYIEIRTERGDGYFVLAGDLGATRWELLLRNAGDAADTLVKSPLGTTIDASVPLGNGFPTGRARDRALVLTVVGSALAVARPVMRQRILENLASRTHVFVGVRRPSDLPLPLEIEAWARAGARVVLCLSLHEDSGPAEALFPMAREHGYVQRIFGRALEAGLQTYADALVIAVGPDAMIADMRTLAADRALDLVTNV